MIACRRLIWDIFGRTENFADFSSCDFKPQREIQLVCPSVPRVRVLWSTKTGFGSSLAAMLASFVDFSKTKR